jgi:tetratricopeptide (TPR) repeat protein
MPVLWLHFHLPRIYRRVSASFVGLRHRGVRWVLLGSTVLWIRTAPSLSAEPTPPSTFQMALTAYEDYRYSDAQRLFERVLAGKPEDPPTNFYLGRISLWFDDASKGLAELEIAARAEPNDAGIQNALGDAFGLTAQKASVFLKLSWAAKSKTAYERAVELDPKVLAYRWSLLEFYQMAPKIAGGGPEKAYAQAAEIMKIDAVNGHAAQAGLYLMEGKVNEAFAEFDGPLRTKPGDVEALFYIGRCAAVSGERLDRGIAALRQCLAAAPSGVIDRMLRGCLHFRLGNVLEKNAEIEAAHAEYDLALKEWPDFRSDKLGLRY